MYVFSELCIYLNYEIIEEPPAKRQKGPAQDVWRKRQAQLRNR